MRLEEVACALCGERDAKVLLEQQDLRYSETPRTVFSLVECRRCRLRYVNPRPAAESLGLFYPNVYYTPRLMRREELRGSEGWFRRLRPARRIRQVREKLRDIQRMTPAGGRILEYGPGGGDLMVAIEQAGFRVVGVDRSAEAIAWMRGDLGLTVYSVEEAVRSLGASSIDTAVLWNVLEHIPDPVPFLGRIRAWLRPGGALIFSVPNGAAWEHSVFFRGDPCEDIPRHLYSYTPRTVRLLLETCGFSVKGVRHRTLCSASAVQYWIEGRFFRKRRRRVLQAAYVAGVLPILWFLDRVFALFGRSHTIVGWAQADSQQGNRPTSR